MHNVTSVFIHIAIRLLCFLICSTIQLIKLIIRTTDCVSILHCVRSFVVIVIVVTVLANSYSQLSVEITGFCSAHFVELF